MGWWDDFTQLLSTAGSAYYAIATKPEVRKKIAGKALDSFNAPGSIGEKLVSGIDAITFRAGYNPNEIPQVGKDVIRTAGDVIGFAESQLPGIDAIHAGLTSATELAAGRDPAHLKDLAVETAVAFAPPGVAEAYSAYKALSDLPVADAAIKREVIAPPKSVPMIPNVPTVPEILNPKPTLEPVAPKTEPKIPAEVPVPKPPSAKPPSISNTYDLFDKSQPKFEPSFAPPAEARSYSRIERLDNLVKSGQQEIQPFLPPRIGMSRKAFIQEHQRLVKVLEQAKPSQLKKEAMAQYAELSKVKRRVKKTK
jgi:hypothetical protein